MTGCVEKPLPWSGSSSHNLCNETVLRAHDLKQSVLMSMWTTTFGLQKMTSGISWLHYTSKIWNKARFKNHFYFEPCISYHKSGKLWYLSVWCWFISLSITVSNYLDCIAKGRITFFCYEGIVYHTGYTPHFLFLVICWGAFRLIPHLNCCEFSCYKHGCKNVWFFM